MRKKDRGGVSGAARRYGGGRDIRRSKKNQSPHKLNRKSWYRSWFAILIAVILLIAVAAGSVLAIKLRGSSSAKAASSTDAAVHAKTSVNTKVPSSVEQIVASMPLEQKVGQMIMAGFDGKTTDSLSGLIKDDHIGGIIIGTANIDSQTQVAQLDASFQQLAAQAGAPAKLMIATDQEGGKTRRFMDIGPNYSEPFIGEMRGGAGQDAAREMSFLAARQLRQIGINTDLAPVADVSAGWGTLMDTRSYGNDPEVTSLLTGAAVTGFNDATTISCVKHFPGLGFADGDPESGSATVSSSKSTLDNTDLPPFKEAIKDGAPMIMVTHVIVPALDPTKTPASLSRPIITDLLRNQMGFQGVVITDDLEMGAITRSPGDAAVAAVSAGADIVMFAHTPAKADEAYKAIIAAVKSGKISEDSINQSVVRILEMKSRYRLESSGSDAGYGNTSTGSGIGGSAGSSADQGTGTG
ncbi:MAG: hypothetical protein M1309_01525 [Actinobacteria bacterium]|nr:hypothetical protein [Actinomycetota bacterium]